MTEQHTPGPWEVADDTPDIIKHEPDGITHIASCDVACFSPGFIPIEEMDANARLIAAAPELLAALEHLTHRYLFNNSEEDAAVKQARAAIAKAKKGHDGQ